MHPSELFKRENNWITDLDRCPNHDAEHLGEREEFATLAIQTGDLWATVDFARTLDGHIKLDLLHRNGAMLNLKINEDTLRLVRVRHRNP